MIIHYSISGSRSPVSVRPCSADGTTGSGIINGLGWYVPATFPYIAVTYDDGTEEIYDADGAGAEVQVIEGPGSLQYIKQEWHSHYKVYYYVYTEDGVSTDEVALISDDYGGGS